MNPDDLCGHAFLPPEDALAAVPRLYETESIPLKEKLVHLHFFTGPCDWYVVELGEDWRIAFGWVNLGDPQNAELGYFDLNELRALLIPGMPPIWVERDLHWEVRPLGECVNLS